MIITSFKTLKAQIKCIKGLGLVSWAALESPL